MKFLHVADLHLGKTLGEFDLTKDQKYILGQIVAYAKEEGATGILVAGDVYDKSVPSEAATRLLNDFLKELAENNIPVFMVSGNHDSEERLNFGASLFAAKNIYISSVFDGKLRMERVTDGDLTVDIYLLPFVKASFVRHFYPDETIGTYEDAVRVILKNTPLCESHVNILVAHQFVAGKGEDPALAGSESVGTQSVGLVEKIGYGMFSSFDYVALGHIHSPQRVGRDEVRYAGSPLKYSLQEVHNEKSVPLITVLGKKKLSLDFLPLQPLRDVRHLRGQMDALLNKEHVTAPEDFIYATLTNEEIIDDAIGYFRQVYPNTVRIDFDNSHTRELERVDITTVAERKSFSEFIADFYRQIYGASISDEEMDVMRSAAKEAGVLHEAG